MILAFTSSYILESVLYFVQLASDMLFGVKLFSDKAWSLGNFLIYFFGLSICLDIFTILNGGQLGDYDDLDEFLEDDAFDTVLGTHVDYYE